MRHYRYYLDATDLELDTISMAIAAQCLVGTHDFKLLSKRDGNRSSKATLLNASISESGGIIALDIYGTSFLWKLVRKIVSLLLHVGRNELSPELVREVLQKHDAIRGGIRPAAAECLVLMEAVVPLRMNLSKLALRRVRKSIDTRLSFFVRSARVMSALSDDFPSSLGAP
jgi:tRNA pseudouridine38-40 synthase